MMPDFSGLSVPYGFISTFNINTLLTKTAFRQKKNALEIKNFAVRFNIDLMNIINISLTIELYKSVSMDIK